MGYLLGEWKMGTMETHLTTVSVNASVRGRRSAGSGWSGLLLRIARPWNAYPAAARRVASVCFDSRNALRAVRVRRDSSRLLRWAAWRAARASRTRAAF